MKEQKWYGMDLRKVGEVLEADLHQGLSLEETESVWGNICPQCS